MWALVHNTKHGTCRALLIPAMLALFVRAIFPYLERMFCFLRTDARQEYLLGILSKDATALIAQLRIHGFEDQLFAWVDDGQIASLRKRDGIFQYHIRIFEDGEVRGHYEYAPEAAPIKHLRRIKREERRGEFREIVEGFVAPAAIQSHQDTFSPVRQASLTPSY